jgi:cysteine desulfurase
MTVYMDCNATTPIEPAVRDVVLRYMAEEYGNEGSRTHEFGARAKAAVQVAREQVAKSVGASKDEVIFTSGATEANNIAILGLAPFGERQRRKHVVSTQIEHKAVLEPLEELARRGFEVTLVRPTRGGWVDPGDVLAAVRPDTLLVSVQQANNETGVRQPLGEIAAGLAGHHAYLHTDAAQGFGKESKPLRLHRVDLISASAHKLYAPKGVGCLVARRRGFDRPPLSPLLFGGGQERGLRPGTLPVHLVVGFGMACALAEKEGEKWTSACLAFRERLLGALLPLGAVMNGDASRTMDHVTNLSLPGIDSEALMVAWKGIVAVSNGSACTSHSYAPSHVLQAMGLSQDSVQGAVRLSWCHLTEEPDWNAILSAVRRLS